MNDVRPMYVQVRSDEWERMKNELQELRGDKAVEYSFKLSAACNIKPTKEMIEIITEACIFAFGDGLTKGIVAACNVLSNDEVRAAMEQQTEEKGAEDAEKGN